MPLFYRRLFVWADWPLAELDLEESCGDDQGGRGQTMLTCRGSAVAEREQLQHLVSCAASEQVHTVIGQMLFIWVQYLPSYHYKYRK